MKADEVASPTLPHFAGLTWRLDVPRASRATASTPSRDTPAGHRPVYSLRLSLAHMQPTPMTASPPLNVAAATADAAADDDASTAQSPAGAAATATRAVIEDVAFACTPETLLALADAVDAAVKQSEQAPYRRILRLIR